MNAEETERLLMRACTFIEVDMELKANLRKVIADLQKTEKKAEVRRFHMMGKIECAFIKLQRSLHPDTAHWL